MKSLYLILASTVVVVTCKTQPISNAVIWYPSNDDEDVFISLFGERRRTGPKNRSHRQARHAGIEPSFPFPYFDPTENRDPSFFNNINDRRRPVMGYPPIPKLPPAFLSEPVPKRPHKRPPGHEKPHKRPEEKPEEKPQENFQNIFNEIFDYEKHPPASENPGGTTSQWGSRPDSQLGGATTGNYNQRPGNQWESTSQQFGQRPTGRPGNQNQLGGTTIGNNNNQRPWESTSEAFGQRPTGQWGNRPNNQNQVGGTTTGNNQRPGNQWQSTSQPFEQRPSTSSQWGSSRPVQRPTNGQLIDASRPSNRPTSQSDKLIFPGQELTSLSTSMMTTTTATPFELIPTEPPTMSPCEIVCPVTPEFNPVCGSDGVTYTNAGRLKCANMCGKSVRLSHYGNCGRPPLSTPLVSSTPRQKFRGFWFVDN